MPGDGDAGNSGAPIVDAGEDQTVLENALVVLDGSSSSDPDGRDLSFQWSRVSGPLITFVGSRTSHPTFVAPSLGHNLTLELKLEVGNGLETAEDATTIHVVQNEGDLPTRMCDDPNLPLHPFVEFIVEPVDGPGPLTIDCTAVTSDGSELLSGSNVLYTWTVDGEADSGPMETHANRSFVLSSSGAHAVTLCLTLSGLSWGCLDAQNPGLRERTVFVWPKISGTVGDDTGGIPGVAVGANNVPGGVTDVTDSQGRYELSVPLGWSGVITPHHVDYDFQPASLEQVETTTSVSNQDFVASSSGSTDIGIYGPEDLAALLGSWGPCEGCPYDLNGDGEVGEEDLAILLANWGGIDESIPDPIDPLEHCTSDLDCNDGNFCNGPETCVDLVCLPGVDPCPAQMCDEPGEACVDCLAAADCDDGIFCNGTETCVNGSCVPGSNACPDQLCDEDADSCFDQSCSADAECDDSLFCNGTETCVNGMCASGSVPCSGQQCDDASDACVECLIDADCDDGVFCNGAETCQANSCVAASDPCPGQMCDVIIGACADCLRNSDCDDGLFCNGGEKCQSGSCIDGTAPCSGQTCDEASDSCTCSTDADCDDGLFCNGTEMCTAGSCTAGSAPCAANEICDETTDLCTAASGNIYYVATNDPNADDSNPGSEALPFKTIQAAADAVDPGDTVYVKAGTYTRGPVGTWRGTVEIGRSGTADLPIVFQPFEDADGNRDAVRIDAQNGTQFYTIRVGNPLNEITVSYVVIDGFEVVGAERNGVYILKGDHVTIRNCEVHHNNHSWLTNRAAGAVYSGIHLVRGEAHLIENNRAYFNGGGIGSIELYVNSHDPVGVKQSVFRNNFVYCNTNSGTFGNSGGLGLRFGEECVIENNVTYYNPDGGILGLGIINSRIIRNTSINNWQEPGNREGFKFCVRGGGGNLLAFNVAAYNGQRGFDAADGIGDILINNTFYAHEQWGYLLEGWLTVVFNCVGSDNFISAPSRPNSDIVMSSFPTHQIDAMHTISNYNFFGDEMDLPNVGPWGHVQPNTFNGDPFLANPNVIDLFQNNDPFQIIHPEELFVDANSDGTVTIEEAQADIAARFALLPGSEALGSGLDLNGIEALIDTAIPDIIAMAQARRDAWLGDGVLQHQQAVSMWGRLIANLQAPGNTGYGDLSGLRNMNGDLLPMNTPVDMGASQSP